MVFPSRASLRQQAADRGRWLSAITLKATNELYQRCAEHAAHLISAKAPAMQAHASKMRSRISVKSIDA